MTQAFEVSRGAARLPGTLTGDESAPPLLYLYGLSALGSIAQREAPSGYRLATFDERGHGRRGPH